jgi:hypothetical protein
MVKNPHRSLKFSEQLFQSTLSFSDEKAEIQEGERACLKFHRFLREISIIKASWLNLTGIILTQATCLAGIALVTVKERQVESSLCEYNWVLGLCYSATEMISRAQLGPDGAALSPTQVESVENEDVLKGLEASDSEVLTLSHRALRRTGTDIASRRPRDDGLDVYTS